MIRKILRAQEEICNSLIDCGSPDPGQKTRPCVTQEEKRTCHLVEFTVPVDHRVKIKESEKIHKYLDLARGLKNLWNMKMMVIPIVIGALKTVPESWEKKVRKNWKSKEESRPLFISVIILGRIRET